MCLVQGNQLRRETNRYAVADSQRRQGFVWRRSLVLLFLLFCTLTTLRLRERVRIVCQLATRMWGSICKSSLHWMIEQQCLHLIFFFCFAKRIDCPILAYKPTNFSMKKNSRLKGVCAATFALVIASGVLAGCSNSASEKAKTADSTTVQTTTTTDTGRHMMDSTPHNSDTAHKGDQKPPQ